MVAPLDDLAPARLSSLFDLSGRHVLVTGAASGLGRAVCFGMVAFGARVTIVDRDQEGLDATAEQLSAVGSEVDAIACDIVDPDDVDTTVDHAESLAGPVTGLVNSAGIGRRSPAVDMVDHDWRDVIDVNLGGTLAMCRAVGSRLIRRSKSGSIVNISSIAGQVGLRTGNANYAASKGGVDALTRTLAVEWAANDIRVNAVAPTHFLTPLVERALSEDPSRLDYFVGNIPLRRLGRPVDMVAASCSC